MTTNQIAYFSAKEAQRHNLAMEGETQRHNVESEKISTETNTINRTHLQMMDSETQRHNLATEEATRRELGIKEANLNLGIRAQTETERHNRASESLTSQSLSETVRHNTVSESLESSRLSEIERENKYQDAQTAKVNSSIIAVNTSKAAQQGAETALTNAKTIGQNVQNYINNQTKSWQIGQIKDERQIVAEKYKQAKWQTSTQGIITGNTIGSSLAQLGFNVLKYAQ